MEILQNLKKKKENELSDTEIWFIITSTLDAFPEINKGYFTNLNLLREKIINIHNIELSIECLNYFLNIDLINEYEATKEEIENSGFSNLTSLYT